jgi:hypothetical protein
MANVTLTFEALPVHDATLEAIVSSDARARTLAFEVQLVDQANYAEWGPWLVVAFDVRDFDFGRDFEVYREAQILRNSTRISDSGRRHCQISLEPHRADAGPERPEYLELNFSCAGTVAYPADR